MHFSRVHVELDVLSDRKEEHDNFSSLKGQHGDQKEKLQEQQATVDNRPTVDQIHSELLVANPVVNSIDSYAFSGNVDHKQERQEATCSVDDQLVPKVEEMDQRHECQNSRPHSDVVVHDLQMRFKSHTKDLLPVEHTSKPYSIESDAIGVGDYPESEFGEMVACSAGASFTHHVITVASGEDVTMKIISFAQQGPQAICILSANGIVSNVTLRQPESSGDTLIYEGRFELLSLSGSFMPTETGGTKSRSGGMSVALASADGRVVGRGVSGLLVAVGPVQVVVGSFMPGYQMEQNMKKLKLDTWRPTPAVPISSVGFDKSYGGLSNPKPRPATSSFFHGDNWVMSGTRTMEHKVSETRNSPAEEKRSSYFRL